jgi:hypothetical protein
MAQGGARVIHVAVLLGGVGITWLTGSRTGLAALLLACLLVVALAPRLLPGGFVALLASVPLAFYLVGFTGLFAAYFGRGGSENITTLNSRTIAWGAAFLADTDFWQQWFGGGLSVKVVPVTGAWESQVLDSTWVSTYVQGGFVGLAVVSVWALTTLWRALAAPVSHRGLWVGLAVYAVLRSVLETGLLDSYALFLVILVPSLVSDLRGSQSLARGDVRRTAPGSRTPG